MEEEIRERRRIEEERRRYGETDEARAEEHRQRMLEEQRLREYVARNQPTRSNVSSSGGNPAEDRGVIERTGAARPASRRYDVGSTRYRSPSEGRRQQQHGPSAPSTYIDPRTSEVWRRQEEERRRLAEERMQEEARRREALRREEEYRRQQSQRYEEQRKRQEAARLEAERRRKELIEEAERRSQAGRRSRPRDEDRRHRRPIPSNVGTGSVDQSDPLAPSNLVLDESRRMAMAERQRQEARRLEAERAREERRKEQYARNMKEQWRRHEEARLGSLPVSARIILRSGAAGTPSSTQILSTRAGFGNEIDFPGINPNRGIKAPRFPAPMTTRPPAKTPSPCVWAVVQCCTSNRNRLVNCFESMGCPGSNWDNNPCRRSVMEAAEKEITQFYDTAENDDY